MKYDREATGDSLTLHPSLLLESRDRISDVMTNKMQT
jgi:hypothetical protein